MDRHGGNPIYLHQCYGVKKNEFANQQWIFKTVQPKPGFDGDDDDAKDVKEVGNNDVFKRNFEVEDDDDDDDDDDEEDDYYDDDDNDYGDGDNDNNNNNNNTGDGREKSFPAVFGGKTRPISTSTPPSTVYVGEIRLRKDPSICLRAPKVHIF